MTETQTARREGMLRKVRALLAKADDTPFTAEADTFRQKADELMMIYAIQDFELSAEDKRRETPTSRIIVVAAENSPISSQLINLASAVSKHCRAKIVFLTDRHISKGSVKASVIGFPSDLDYFELLFTSLHLQLASTLEPKRDPTRTKGQNVKIMKESGMKWERIAQLCDIPFPGPQAIGIYKKECRAQGTTPLKTAPITYVRNFTTGFVTEVTDRLYMMRKTTEQNTAGLNDNLPVLWKTRQDEINEETRRLYPHLSTMKTTAAGKYDPQARGAGKASGSKADLSGGRNRVNGSRGALDA